MVFLSITVAIALTHSFTMAVARDRLHNSRTSPKHQHAAHVRSYTASTVNNKRGVAYDETKYVDAFGSSQISWAWNWKSKPGDWGFDGTIPTGIEYVPMMYDLASAETFLDNVEIAVDSGTRHVLGFNEIDQCGGGGTCINITQAAIAYRQIMQPLASKVRIGSPSVTSDQDPVSGKGIAALIRFLEACSVECPVGKSKARKIM